VKERRKERGWGWGGDERGGEWAEECG